jgi:hypothetical protein
MSADFFMNIIRAMKCIKGFTFIHTKARNHADAPAAVINKRAHRLAILARLPK